MLGKSASKFGFAVTYLLAGVCGSLASILWNPDVVSVGASGAIFGLYGALLGFLLRERQCLPQAVRQRLARTAFFFIVFNLLFSLASKGVDIAAHLGGLAGGVLCGLAIALPITPEGFARRSRTNALVLAGGLLVVLGMIAALPKGRGLSAGLDKAGKREAQALAAFSSAAALAQQGRLSNAQFADAIQNQVVYGLRESRASLDGLEKMPRARVGILMAMEDCTRAREEAFTHMATAIRNGDQEGAHQAWEEQVRAVNAFQETLRNTPQ